MAAPIILIEAQPRDPVTGAAVPVRLAGGGGLKPYLYDGEHWRAGIAGLPTSIAKLDFDGEQLGGGGVPQALAIEWGASTNAQAAALSSLYWADAPVTLRIGTEADVLPPVATAGLCLDASSDRGVLNLAFADLATDLKRPFLVHRFAGTGDTEGPIEWKGQIKSRALGPCWNVPGKPIEPGFNIWCFGDPSRAWEAFVEVRDMGVPALSAIVLGWQGSVAATYAALKAAAAPAGGCVVAPSIACVKWWTTPGGDLRADIKGENAGGYVETAPEIVARLVAARSTLPFAAGAVAAAAAARPMLFGWRCDSETVTAAAAVSEVLGDVSLSWVVVDGAIEFRRWEWTPPIRSVRTIGTPQRRKLFKPIAVRKLAYRKNQAPMARGDLAAIVLARDVVFDDGRTVADLSDRVADLGSDNVITSGREKRELVREWRALETQFVSLLAKYVALGSPADLYFARNDAADGYNALAALLASYAPAWDDVAHDTPVDGAALNTLWISTRQKIEVFAASITGRPGASAITLVAGSATTIVDTNSVRGTAGVGWGTDAAYSSESYTGGCVLNFVAPPVHGDDFMAGLTQGNPGSNPGNSFDSITFSIFRQSDGHTDVRINGTQQAVGPNVTGELRGRIQFDGRYVRWFINEAQVGGAFDWMGAAGDPNAAVHALRFRCALASNDPRVENISLVPRGVDGVPGTPGQNGTTIYPYYAFANSPDGAVDFTVGEAGTRTYIGVGSGTSPTEPTSPIYYTWTPYRGPPFGLATRGNAVVAGNQIIKNGGVNDWDSDAFSTVGYRGGAAASFKFALGYGAAMAGLNKDPTLDGSYYSLDAAFYGRNDGFLDLYENGQGIGTYGSYDANTSLLIAYDNRYLRYLKDGVVVRELDVGPGIVFYFDSSLADPGARITDIGFTANGARGGDGTSPFSATLSTTQIVVPATVGGVTKPNALPKNVSLRVKQGTTDVTASAAVGLVSNPANTINASYSNGVISITDVLGDGYLDVGIGVGATPVDTLRINIRREIDQAPSGVSAVFEQLVSSFGYDARVTPVMTVAADSNGQIRGEMYVDYYPSAGNGNFNVRLAAKMHFSPANTGSWQDMAAEAVGTTAYKSGRPNGPPNPDDPPPPEPTPGQLYFGATVGGLAPGANYEMYGLLRRYDGNANAVATGSITARRP